MRNIKILVYYLIVWTEFYLATSLLFLHIFAIEWMKSGITNLLLDEGWS